jgi:prepilin-type N-terminal cleavage/methylation domain-containing protein
MKKVLGKFAGQRRSSGFTLLELVVVVAVIGVLAAVAAPRLIDVGADARLAQLTTTAKTTSSLSAANYSARAAGGAGSTEATDLASCADAADVWLDSEGGMPVNAVVSANILYTDASTQGSGTTAGETETCYLYSAAAPWIEVSYTLYTSE